MNISLLDDICDNLTAIDFGSWLMMVGVVYIIVYVSYITISHSMRQVYSCIEVEYYI